MEKDETLIKHLSQKDPALSLYTEEEIEGVSTTSSFIKSDTLVTGQVSQVSSTSEYNCQVPSISSKSIFMDLFEEEIVNTGIENMNNTEKDTSVGDAVGAKKRKPGLQLLGEYADSGNDTEEEMLNSLEVKQKKSQGIVERASGKDASIECIMIETVSNQSEPPKTSVESDVIKASEELPPTVGKVTSPVVEKLEDNKDSDSHALRDVRKAKLERSVSKEEGQISAESDSSDSEQSSPSRKDSIKQKETKKDKSKKKDKKKKKKRKKQKHSGDKKDSDVTGDEKKERKSIRSRSRESSEKCRSSKLSRSRSRDRNSRRHGHSRSRSQDKWKHSRHVREKSRRSRSRSSSRRHSAPNRKKDLKSRSRSPKRSVSPRNRRKERGDARLSTSRSRRDSPSTRKRKVSRSPSPRKPRGWSPEHRRSRSPRKRSYSPGKRRRTSPEKSPREGASSRKAKSPSRRERKQSQSTPKSLHRTSSASDSMDSGHFTNIPLSKTSKPDESEPDNKEPLQKSSPIAENKVNEPSVLPKSISDVEKQFSPMYSPEKPWEDEFDFVFTEHMSPRQGTDKSMEDVLFGSEAKTPDFKRPTPGESKKNKAEPVAKKEEKKVEKVTGAKEKNVPQKEENQDGSSMLQQPIPTTPESAVKAHDQSISIFEAAAVKTVFEDKTDHVQKRNSDNDSAQASTNANKSAFVQSKLEAIPFLDEAPFTQPPVQSGTVHNIPTKSQLGILGSPPAINAGKNKIELQKAKIDKIELSTTRLDEARNNVSESPMDMEMSSPEGDIIDRMNEEFWKQQQQHLHWGEINKTEMEKSHSRDAFTVEYAGDEHCIFEEPYEPESGLIIGEDYEDLNNITDPKERRKKEKQQQKEKTKVQELIDKLHRQARVEEEVKHVLKAYYKHRDINKEEYKSILRRAVPQVTNSSSAIDPERIRSLVKKYVAKIKGQRVNS